MNILPKKRWHVRTRENIARVRRDEAKAAEEEKQKQLRVEKAEREARTELLRKRAREQYNTETAPKEVPAKKVEQGDQHINLFYELEQDYVTNKSNPEYEKEEKLEREKYEKQIGYLTYLGQDTNEITGNVSWYNRDPEERNNVVEEVSKEAKLLEDPLRDIRKYLGSDGVQKITQSTKKEVKVYPEIKTEEKREKYSDSRHSKERRHSKKSKKEKRKKRKKRKYSSCSDGSNSSDSEEVVVKKTNVNLESLRAERLKREMEERKRAELILKKLKGETIKEEKVDPEIEQKYNSQFNPHLAKQNVFKK